MQLCNLCNPYQKLRYNSTMRTEKDIGSENPETTTVSGFFMSFFKVEFKKSFSKNDLWGELELKFIAVEM